MLLIISMIMSFETAITELVKVRTQYEEAAINEQTATSLLNYLQPRVSESPQMAGYAAAMQIMMAKYYFNPFSKYETFQKGKTQLDGLINKYPKVIELYYLRLSIQCNTPAFLGYNTNIEADKKCLLQHLPEVKDRDLRKRIVAYLLVSNRLTHAEIMQLKHIHE